jgi:hypothetical protein
MRIILSLSSFSGYYLFKSWILTLYVAGSMIKSKRLHHSSIVGGKARLKFMDLSGKSPLRLGKVRWFCFCEVGIQLHEQWKSVVGVINRGGEEDDFAVEGRDALAEMIHNHS